MRMKAELQPVLALDELERRHYVIDIGTQVPHGAVRAYVMGARGAANEPADTSDIEAMALVRANDDEASLYERAAAAEVLGWHDRLVRRLRALGAHVLDVEPRQLTADLVNRYLEIKVRHLL